MQITFFVYPRHFDKLESNTTCFSKCVRCASVPQKGDLLAFGCLGKVICVKVSADGDFWVGVETDESIETLREKLADHDWKEVSQTPE